MDCPGGREGLLQRVGKHKRVHIFLNFFAAFPDLPVLAPGVRSEHVQLTVGKISGISKSSLEKPQSSNQAGRN